MGKDVADKVEGKTAGDELFGFKDSAGQNTVLMRQGRFIVEMVFNRTVQRGELQDVDAMIQKLTPYATSVAQRLQKI